MNVLFMSSLHNPSELECIRLAEIQMEINHFHFKLGKLDPYERVLRSQGMANHLRSTWETFTGGKVNDKK